MGKMGELINTIQRQHWVRKQHTAVGTAWPSQASVWILAVDCLGQRGCLSHWENVTKEVMRRIRISIFPSDPLTFVSLK